MFLINIHKLDVILADSIVLGVLKDQIQRIRRIGSLEGEDILVLGGAEDFGEGVQVDSESNVAVASVWRKPFMGKLHRDEGDV